jgi:hypothetical protein
VQIAPRLDGLLVFDRTPYPEIARLCRVGDALEVVVRLVDVDRDELKKIGATMHKGADKPSATRVMAPIEDEAFMQRITALELRRRARVTTQASCARRPRKHSPRLLLWSWDRGCSPRTG